MTAYESANVAHATAAKDANLAPLQAENERLRAEAERWRSEATEVANGAAIAVQAAEARAERLAEALCELSQCDGSPANVANAEVLAARVRSIANRALSQQPAGVDEAWRQKAAEWLEAKAVEQEANNQRWPDHAAAYKEWRDRPGVLRDLAAQVLAAQHGGRADG